MGRIDLPGSSGVLGPGLDGVCCHNSMQVHRPRGYSQIVDMSPKEHIPHLMERSRGPMRSAVVGHFPSQSASTVVMDRTRSDVEVPVRQADRTASGAGIRRSIGTAVALGALATVVSLLGSWIPSLWGDEAASAMSAQRSIPSLFRMLGHVDAVHGAYYLGLHAWVQVFGASAFSLRLPSAIAVGLTVMAVVVLVRRLSTRRVAVAAGILCAVLPRVTYMGEEARSFAFSAAVAAWLTVLLVAAIQAPVADPRRCGSATARCWRWASTCSSSSRCSRWCTSPSWCSGGSLRLSGGRSCGDGRRRPAPPSWWPSRCSCSRCASASRSPTSPPRRRSRLRRSRSGSGLAMPGGSPPPRGCC